MLSFRFVCRQLLFDKRLIFSKIIPDHALFQSQTRSGEEDEQKTPSKPQRLTVEPETSIRYLESQAYKDAYTGQIVWTHYRRNFKGQYQPRTRKTCVRKGEISTGSPCPICRDEYLVVNFKNIKLLEQFISPETGELLPSKTTGICQKQQKNLRIELAKAYDMGYMQTNIAFREYNYQEYYDMIAQESKET